MTPRYRATLADLLWNQQPVVSRLVGITRGIVGADMFDPTTEHSRWRNDDGSETAATWKAVEDTDPVTIDVADIVRLRLVVEQPNTATGSETFQLQYNNTTQGTGFVNVTTTSSHVRSVASADTSWTISDGDATTDQIGGAGSFVAGEMDEDGNTGSISFSGNDHTELEYVIQLQSSDVANDDNIDFRLTNAMGQVISTNVTPSLTVEGLVAADHNQRAFRIRSTDPVINANGGGDWEAAENVDASIDLDFLFRLRFEIEETESSSDGGVTYKLQFRVNIQSAGYGSWTDVPVGVSVDTTPLGATWPVTPGTDESFTEHFGAMILAGELSPGFSNDAATTDILTTSGSSFVAGVGMHDNLSTSITLNNQHTELEWPILISRWYDGAGGGLVGRKYDAGDTFQFRVVESDSTLFTGDTNSGYDNIPEITATERIGHIGATHIEEPDHIGPFIDGNGALYYFSEYTNVSNSLMLHKSTDGGDTWDEATTTGRPDASDPEGVDVFQEGDDILHIITHRGSDLMEYQEYFMSSHGSSPDTWNTIDDQIDADAGNPGNGDGCSIIKRPSDDKIFVFYMGLESADATLWYTNDNGDGTWQSRLEVDTGGGELAGAHAVLNPVTSDIWFFYMDQANLDIYVRKLAVGGTTVGSRTLVASITFDVNQENNTLRGVYYDDDTVEVIFFTWHERNGGDFNEFRTMRNGSLQTSGIATEFDVERSGGGGHSGVADISVDGKNVHVLYSRLSDRDIYHAENDDEGGFGPTDVERNDAVEAFYVRQHIFTHSSGNGGELVLGYMYEDGPDGRNAGFIEYDEIVLAAAPAGGPFPPGFRRRKLTTVRM